MLSPRMAWRSVFLRSDVPTDSVFSLDDARMLWSGLLVTVPFVPVAIIFALYGLFVPKTPLTTGIALAAVIVALVVTALAVQYTISYRLPPRFAARRATIAGPAKEAGWTYLGSSPLPSPQTLEAVFHYSRYKLIPDSFTEVSTGEFRGHRFTAGHLDGHELPQATQRTPGRPYSENIVMMSLPGLLPELKLRDRTTSIIRDYGWDLAVVPTGDPAFDHRWEVQTNFADFASDLLTLELREFLVSVPPVPCTLVFRNGYLIASRDPEATFDSVNRRLEILAGVIERLPAKVWERETSAQVAGVGLRTDYQKNFAGPGI